MEIKKYRKILISIIIFVVIVSISAILYTMPIGKNFTSSSKHTNVMYVIKDYDGRVAIFKADETTPYRILDVYTETLPSADKITLMQSNGITVENENKLNSLIEDFES